MYERACTFLTESLGWNQMVTVTQCVWIKMPKLWVYFLQFDIDKLDAHLTKLSLLGIRHVEAEVLDIKALLVESQVTPAKIHLYEVGEVFKAEARQIWKEAVMCWQKPMTIYASRRHSACYRSSHVGHPSLISKKEGRCIVTLAAYNVEKKGSSEFESRHFRSGAKKSKNIQQRGFASGHPPNY